MSASKGELGSWNHSLLRRTSDGDLTNSTAGTLNVVGIACGALAAVVLITIFVYLILRQYRKQALPSSSRTRNGSTQTRTTSGDTHGSTRKEMYGPVQSGYKYDPESAFGLLSMMRKEKRNTVGRECLQLDTALYVPKQTSLMESATSPPPFMQRDSILGQPIRPRAELRVGDTPVENPVSKPGRYIPPAPPSWASIWPTESGWIGPGGVPSIRDEDFGGSDESISSEDAKEKATDGDRVSQYALDARPTEDTFGPCKLSPSLFGTIKHRHSEADLVLDQPTAIIPSPQPLFHSPQLEDDDESEAVELARLMDGTDQFERSATGDFTLAFGTHDSLARSGTSSTSTGKSTRSGSTQTKGHSRTPDMRSSTRLIWSSTSRTAQTEEPGSLVLTVSGQIFSVLTDRLAMPLLRSVESFGRVAASVEERERLASGEERTSGAVSTDPCSTPIRRLPAVPGSLQIPPVPPIPRRQLTAPGEIRPLPVPMSQSSPRTPDARAIPRTVSLGPGPIPPISLPDQPTTGLARVASETGTMVARLLPVPPAVNS